MSKQSSELPQIPDKQKTTPSKKKKNWSLWHKSSFSMLGGWYRWGRYITKEDAEVVLRQMNLRVFTYPGEWKILYKDERPE